LLLPHDDFDIRDGGALSADEERLTLANQRTAEIEAALSLADAALADTAKDLAPVRERPQASDRSSEH
jgi:hypothetical protein